MDRALVVLLTLIAVALLFRISGVRTGYARESETERINPEKPAQSSGLSRVYRWITVASAIHPLIALLVATALPGEFSFSIVLLSFPIVFASIFMAAALYSKLALGIGFDEYSREMAARQGIARAKSLAIFLVYCVICVIVAIRQLE